VGRVLRVAEEIISVFELKFVGEGLNYDEIQITLGVLLFV
jgi:hypothetical protein